MFGLKTTERVLTKLQTYYLVSKREIMKVKIINKRIELCLIKYVAQNLFETLHFNASTWF